MALKIVFSLLYNGFVDKFSNERLLWRGLALRVMCLIGIVMMFSNCLRKVIKTELEIYSISYSKPQ